MLLFLTSLLVTVSVAQQNNCVYQDKQNGLTFDLTSAEGTVLKSTSGSFEYLYSPCENKVLCNEVNAMATQQDSKGNCQAYLGLFNETVQPSYSPPDDSWTFVFNNGQKSGGCTMGRTFTATWICNPAQQTRKLFMANAYMAHYNPTNKQKYIIAIVTAYESAVCQYNMDIVSNHCAQTSGDSCVYHDMNAGLTFDLSKAKGDSYVAQSGAFNFEYSPCENHERGCNVEAMAVQKRLSDETCLAYLGLWDPNVQPIYSPADKSWTFRFANGQVSGGCVNPRSFIATYFCDPSQKHRLAPSLSLSHFVTWQTQRW